MSKKLITVSVMAIGLIAGNIHGAMAAEAKAATISPKVVPTQLKGTIVALDRRANTVTIDVKGKLLTVNLTRQLRLSRQGKTIEVAQLVPGQTVTLTFLELNNGQIEVASISVEANSDPVEAAGPGKSQGAANRRTPALPPQAPFNFPPNPANIAGGLVSPHK